MNNTLEIFKEITQIEHCSKNTNKLLDYLISKAIEYNYEYKTDTAGNLYTYKLGNTICLQSHYDMVCIGKAPNIEIYEEVEDNGINYLKANNSSLGADNGMGVAMILNLMSQNKNISGLFTNDEEIGLIGANDLEINITEKYIINLDSEDEGDVFIGCAGGVDIISTLDLEFTDKERNLDFYELTTINYQGGHSGLEIDKEIPNAIIDLVNEIKDLPVELVSINGGEKRNSIPVNCSIIVGVEKKRALKIYNNNIQVRMIENSTFKTIKNQEDILEAIGLFKDGVIKFNEELEIPQTSINLAIISTSDINNKIEIAISARSMDNQELEDLVGVVELFFSIYKHNIKYEYKYPAWKPEKTELSNIVLEESRKMFKNASFTAIHAGLECGLLKDKFPNVEIVSFGPNIYSPHTNKEKVDLNSVIKVDKLLGNIIKVLNKK